MSNETLVLYFLLVTLLTWGATALGAAVVFLVREVNRRLMVGMFGFASGIMIAASFWSLLSPSIAMSRELDWWPWVPPLGGFLAGGLFLWCFDKILPHLHPGNHRSPEGPPTHWERSTLLVFAMTIHKIPEGLAIGVAFGAVSVGVEATTLTAAFSLLIGLCIQNIPEGTAISLPLRYEGLSRFRCFWYGQLSGMVVPIFAIVGAFLVTQIQAILPFALAFAAGAMFYIIIEELIPTSQENENGDVGTVGTMAGFAMMMTLDIMLG